LAFCPVCNQKVLTHVELEAGKFAHLWAVIFCLLGNDGFRGCFGCCFIPFYLRGFSDVTHTCPRCGTTLGARARRKESYRTKALSSSENVFTTTIEDVIHLNSIMRSGFISFKIGESFFHLSTEEANDKVGEQKAQLKERLVTLESELSDCKATMATLKKELYAKFGDNINLEDC
uniref:LITAF domain-containing protein n=1 Tax=Hydatigena taeniaeformis TaxID=6205 RepID=A0A0R3X2A5_HYDTA